MRVFVFRRLYVTSRFSQCSLKLSSGKGQASVYASIRSSKIATGNPWTRRKSVSLVIKRAQPALRAVAA